MEFLHGEIEREYTRWLKLVGAEDPYTSRYTVGLHEVLRAHFLIADFFIESDYGIGGVGPRDQNLLHSAIYRQFITFGGKEKWPEPYEKCATLMFGLVKDHPFHDANKRTALLVTLYQLDKLHRIPKIRQKEFENFVVEVADNRLAKYARYRELSREEEDSEVLFIADFLKRNTRQIDGRYYTVTYHQLNQLLRKYSFGLANPSGNFINVVRVETRHKYLGIVGPAVTREIRLAQIGFPGWKRQVGRGALKTVREATGLTQQRGYDSAVFYQDADPLHALIDMYSEPLRRLANR
ncbi:MAG TPA: Fic family protein [Burkholderiales bacterium]|nr:Fic family protein [Burkholderiales bacterium]